MQQSDWGINTGVTAYRDSPATRAFLTEWRDVMLDPQTLLSHVDDQRSFVIAMVDSAPSFKERKPFRRNPHDAHAFYAGSKEDLEVRTTSFLFFAPGAHS